MTARASSRLAAGLAARLAAGLAAAGALVVAALAVGCGLSSNAGGEAPDASATADAGAGCSIDLQYDPDPAFAGSNTIERVTAIVQPAEVYTYAWTVLLGSDGSAVAFEPLGGSNDGGASAIDFAIPTPGEYSLGLEVTSTSQAVFCTTGQTLNVGVAGANTASYLARITPAPPSGGATALPPVEEEIVVTGGADQAIDLDFPQLQTLSGTVTASGMPVVAYLRITPVGSSTFVDAFSDGGSFGPLSVVATPQTILIVPTDQALAPSQIAWSAGEPTSFTVGTGTAVTGRVVGGGGAGIAGATVQLVFGGVLPSTVATTGSDGSFTLAADLGDPDLTSSVTVAVTPAVTSGLPRLTATAGFTPGQALAIAYPSQATRDLVGVELTQGGAAVAGAQLAVVGTVASFAATIDGVAAANTLLVGATTGSGGAIAAATVVPAAPVSVVATLATGEVEVVAVDLTSGAPASIALPAAATAGGVVTDSQGIPLAGVLVELQPAGALALAGALPVQATTAGDGSYQVSLAASGTYDVRVVDLDARGPLVTALAQTPAQIGNFALAAGLVVDGIVSLPDLSPAIGASVQLLCATCTGVAAQQPIAESSTDLTGAYRVSVPDPGVN